VRIRLLSVAATAGALCLLLAPTTPARVAHDPCEDLRRDLHCDNVIDIPAHRTRSLRDIRSMECPYRVAGTDRSQIQRPKWDYWTYRGQWVTAIGFPTVVYEHDRVTSIFAKAHNWYLRPWKARMFYRCEPNPDNARAVAAAAREDDAGRSLAGTGHDDALTGGAGDDLERGGGGDDVLRGAGGKDALAGGDGQDSLSGGDGADHLEAGSGADALRGGDGADDLLGGPGADEAWGGDGEDELFDDAGHDRLHGGAGNDRFSAHDGNADLIDCGPGIDQVVADPLDRTIDCEQVWRSAEEAPDVPPEV
jgi:hypothetical protein